MAVGLRLGSLCRYDSRFNANPSMTVFRASDRQFVSYQLADPRMHTLFHPKHPTPIRQPPLFPLTESKPLALILLCSPFPSPGAQWNKIAHTPREPMPDALISATRRLIHGLPHSRRGPALVTSEGTVNRPHPLPVSKTADRRAPALRPNAPFPGANLLVPVARSNRKPPHECWRFTIQEPRKHTFF